MNHVGMSSVVVGGLGIAIIALGGRGCPFTRYDDRSRRMARQPPVDCAGRQASPSRCTSSTCSSGGQDSGDDRTADGAPGRYASERLPLHFAIYTFAALVVVSGAVWLSFVGDKLAIEMGWQASFMGTQFLAAATSLPELSTSFAALRIAAPELAITNLLGSNLFNMGFILFLDDVAYTGGPIWGAISPIHALTGFIAIIMTAIVVLAVVTRPRKDRPGFGTVESALLIGVYAIASVIVFALG